MTTNTQTVPTRSMEEALGDTELGGTITKYKLFFIGAIVASILGVIGFAIYSSQQEKTNTANSNLIEVFATTELNSFEDKKITAPELITSLQALQKKIKGFSALNVLNLQVSDALIKQDQKEAALTILSAIKNVTNPYMKYFYLTRLAAVQEDLNKYNEAIKSLELLVSNSVKPFEGKIYLDLGRLYLKEGNQKKAKVNFEYVVKNAKENEFKKMAKLYLLEI